MRSGHAQRSKFPRLAPRAPHAASPINNGTAGIGGRTTEPRAIAATEAARIHCGNSRVARSRLETGPIEIAVRMSAAAVARQSMVATANGSSTLGANGPSCCDSCTGLMTRVSGSRRQI